jgi:hypothetical protein
MSPKHVRWCVPDKYTVQTEHGAIVVKMTSRPPQLTTMHADI